MLTENTKIPPQAGSDQLKNLRRGAVQGPAVPAILPAGAVRPEPEELLPRQ